MNSDTQPVMRTEVPGPVSIACIKELDTVFDSRPVHFVVDYDKSEGN